jgi:hypothetical protein
LRTSSGQICSAPKTEESGSNLSLSEKAITLLNFAVEDPRGEFLYVETMGKTTIQTNDQDLTLNSDARELAAWREVPSELVNLGLASEYAPGVFRLTKNGFSVGDELPR